MAINIKNQLACVLVRANVVVSGALINRVTSSRYLGVYSESCSKFKSSFASNQIKSIFFSVQADAK